MRAISYYSRDPGRGGLAYIYRADNRRVNFRLRRTRSLLLSADRRKRKPSKSSRGVPPRAALVLHPSRTRSTARNEMCACRARNSSNHRRLNIESLAISGVTCKKEQRKAINAHASRAADEWLHLKRRDPSRERSRAPL